jgi:hypothetical protein
MAITLIGCAHIRRASLYLALSMSMPSRVQPKGTVFGFVNVNAIKGAATGQSIWLFQCQCHQGSSHRAQHLALSMSMPSRVRPQGTAFGFVNVNAIKGAATGHSIWLCQCQCHQGYGHRAQHLALSMSMLSRVQPQGTAFGFVNVITLLFHLLSTIARLVLHGVSMDSLKHY